MIVWVSLRLGKKSVADLLDRVPLGLQEKVAAAAAATPGVLQVAQVRLRRSGPEFFADVTLSVGHATSFEQAHEVSDAAAAAVRAILPGADVVVHAEPAPSPNEELTTTVRVLAARHGLGAHGIRIYDEEKQRWIELHLEVEGRLTLDEAHAQATAFERELRGRARPFAGRFPPGAERRRRGDGPRGAGDRRGSLPRPGRIPPPPSASEQAAQRRRAIGRRGVAGFLSLPPEGGNNDDRSARPDGEAGRVSPPAGPAPRPRRHSRRAGEELKATAEAVAGAGHADPSVIQLAKINDVPFSAPLFRPALRNSRAM